LGGVITVADTVKSGPVQQDDFFDLTAVDMMFVMVMSFVMMLFFNNNRIVSYVQSLTPMGFVEPHSLDVNPTEKELVFANVLQGMTITNDGSYSVFVKVNSSTNNPSEIKPGECMLINFSVHAIERIFYFTLVGGISRMRVDGVY